MESRAGFHRIVFNIGLMKIAGEIAKCVEAVVMESKIAEESPKPTLEARKIPENAIETSSIRDYVTLLSTVSQQKSMHAVSLSRTNVNVMMEWCNLIDTMHIDSDEGVHAARRTSFRTTVESRSRGRRIG